MYSVLCTVYTIHCTLYTVQCTVYNVQCTIHNTYPIRNVPIGTLRACYCVVEWNPVIYVTVPTLRIHYTQ